MISEGIPQTIIFVLSLLLLAAAGNANHETPSLKVAHPSETGTTYDGGPWKGYDAEDINLLFSIIYRAIFKENIFSSNLTKKEILIDGENKEYHLQKQNKLVKMIKDNVLKRIVNLEFFKLVVVTIFQEKYPKIVSSALDNNAIIENILKNFKSMGDTHKVESEAGEEKATDEETDMVEYEANLKELHLQLMDTQNKIKAFEKLMNELPEKIIKNVTSKMNADSKAKKNDLTIKPSKEARTKEDEKIHSMKHEFDNQANKNSGNSSSNQGNGSNNGQENEEFEDISEARMLNEEGFEKESFSTQEKSKLPKKATDILRDWFLKNIDHPYPSAETKEMLCEATGLNKKQVQNWFTNSRKRFLEPLKKKIETTETGKPVISFPQQNNAPELIQGPMQNIQGPMQNIQVQQQQQQTSVPEPFKEQVIQPQIFPQQNPAPIYQAIPQPQNTIIPSQPVIIQPGGGIVPQNGYYYVNPPTIYPQSLPPQPQFQPNFQPNGMQGPNGHIILPAGYIAQLQTTPIILNPTTQGTYVMVKPVPNYVPIGMLPINSTYVVPMQNYPYLDPNAVPTNQSVPDMRNIYPQALPNNMPAFDGQQQSNIMSQPNGNPNEYLQNYSQPEKINPNAMNLQIKDNFSQPAGMMNQIQVYHMNESKFPQNLADQQDKTAPEKKIHKDDDENPINALRQFQQK